MKGKIVNVDRYEPTKNDPNCKTYYPKKCPIFGAYQISKLLQLIMNYSLYGICFYHKNNSKNLIHNTGECKCGNSCRMGNGRIGTCQDDNKTCAQNINQPFCPEGKYNQNRIGRVKVEYFII